MNRASILATIAFVVVLTILVLDFRDNGRIDNDHFLMLALFVFSGAATGRTIDALVGAYTNKRKDPDA